MPALGLAIAVGAWAEAILLLVVLRRREPALDVRGILSVGAAGAHRRGRGAVPSAIVMVRCLAVDARPSIEASVSFLLGSALATLLGGLAYLAIALALRIPELPSMISIVTDVVRRRGRS